MRRRLLAISVTAALLMALLPAAAPAFSADDSFPGVPLPASPVAGSLSPLGGDRDDVYSIPLAAGDELTLSLRADAGTDFTLALLNNDIGTLRDQDALFWFWQPGYPKETSYVVPDSLAATYSVEVHSMDPSGTAGAYSLAWTKRHDKAARLYGLDRLQTSVAVSRSSFVTATTAIIASAADYPDALAAAGLAGVLHAPVLLTQRGGLSDAVWRELQRLQVTEIKIIGSSSVVSNDVELALGAPQPGGAGYDVERIAGPTRFETSRRVAERVKQLGGSSEVFLVSGRTYADALSVSPIAYARKMPVVLTEPLLLSGEAAAALASVGATHAVIAGSISAVSAAVASAAASRLAGNDTGGGHLVERWQGPTRFATAVDVAEKAVGRGWASRANVGLSTAWNFPDALGGGAAVGQRGGVMLFSDRLALTPATKSQLEAHKADVQRVYLLGSASVLSETVRSNVIGGLQ
ncbi:MAG TPA: cell wall-binding repeat-containing protein [Coriobacteriia bacterium]|jgi:putative cell wall-binding protein